MARIGAKIGAAAICAVAVAAVVFLRGDWTSAAPKPDLKPSAHWVFNAEGVTGKTVADKGGKLPGTVLGASKLSNPKDPAGEYLHLTTLDDGVMLKPRVTPDADFLPREAMSVVSWVRVDDPTEWAGILGCFQDNGPVEYGFVVGANKKKFFFGLSTKGADDGDGKMTYLESKTEFTPGKWYHVAATYDGKQMKLYLNGQLDATGAEQSGAINYAKAAPFVIGRYKDDDEDFPLFGALKEVALCPHTITAEQVSAHFDADKQLAALQPPNGDGPKFVVEPYLQFV
ncbi:MAG: LamG domain-containing protein, partial [Gemmataceae bacterium]|nr:LamG domain-containing protein [Gemmataceae bacterium]